MKLFHYLLSLIILLLPSCKESLPEYNVADDLEVIENGLLPPILVKGDSVSTFNILDRMHHYKVPGVSIAIVKDGELSLAKGYGIANTSSDSKVDTNTLFQAGSISKPLAALSALKLVENGSIGLDEDVNLYLKEWKVPENDFTSREKVTLRRLLTHSAGMTVHGFPGYQQHDSLPTITQVLDGDGNTPKIMVDTTPGSIWRYSGGGYTVMEKLVEDITGEPLEEYMANILHQIGMHHSTYAQPLPDELHPVASAAYDNGGEIIDGLWHNYPEQAAAGLWTTPSDLAKYCIAVQNIMAGLENGVLSRETIEKMLTKHQNDWGLGPSLRWEKDSLIFGHGGKNAGFTNEMIAFAYRGDAVIIMTNADNGGKLIDEIFRSVSKHFEWGISNPRIVQLKEVEDKTLEKLTGRYLLDFNVPDLGDYIIHVEIKNDNLFVLDPNNGETNVLHPLTDNKFIDLEGGDEVEFNVAESNLEILWNNRFRFIKIEE